MRGTNVSFNLSRYGNIVVDAKGTVKGMNDHGKELEKMDDAIVDGKAAEKPKP